MWLGLSNVSKVPEFTCCVMPYYVLAERAPLTVNLCDPDIFLRWTVQKLWCRASAREIKSQNLSWGCSFHLCVKLLLYSKLSRVLSWLQTLRRKVAMRLKNGDDSTDFTQIKLAMYQVSMSVILLVWTSISDVCCKHEAIEHEAIVVFLHL